MTGGSMEKGMTGRHMEKSITGGSMEKPYRKSGGEERYERQQQIGQGSFAKVFRGWDRRNRCYVAWKESSYLPLLRQEAGRMKSVEHALFPRFLDYWETEEKGILIMEYVEGTNLAQLLARRKRVSEKRCLEVACRLAEGLLYLHEQEGTLIFRDLKPDNIMIGADGRVRLLDLGCVCEQLSGGRTSAGTKDYGAGEQFDKEQAIGTYSDVYALGKVMQAMVAEAGTGKRGGIEEIIGLCTVEQREYRLPDMRKVLWILGAYSRFLETGGWGKKSSKRQRRFVQKLAGRDVIYQKNVWKKVESS